MFRQRSVRGKLPCHPCPHFPNTCIATSIRLLEGCSPLSLPKLSELPDGELLNEQLQLLMLIVKASVPNFQLASMAPREAICSGFFEQSLMLNRQDLKAAALQPAALSIREAPDLPAGTMLAASLEVARRGPKQPLRMRAEAGAVLP